MKNNQPYTYDKVPDALRSIPAWVLWRKVWKEEKRKWDKVPTQINGYPASVTNRAHYATFEEARFAHQLGVGDGIGFCFTGDQDLVFVDLDNAIADGQWNTQHYPILQAFPTWCELSQSGKGVHLIARGRLDRARVHHPLGVELYSAGRFVAMTGWTLDGWPSEITEQQGAVDQLAAWLDQIKGAAGAQQLEPAGETPPLAEVVPALSHLNIGPEVRAFLEQGDATKWDHDRSRALLAASMSLYRAGLDDSQVLTVMWAHCNHIAEEHRVQGNPVDWLWKYNVARARHASPPTVEELFTAAPTAEPDQLVGLLTRISLLSPCSAADTGVIAQARTILAESMGLDAGSRVTVRDGVRRAMGWTKPEMTEVMREIERESRRLQQNNAGTLDNMMSEYLYVASQHQFMHKPTSDLFKPEAFIALYTHMSPELREIVLAGGGVSKVHGLDFDPSQPEFFRRHGGLYYNTWKGLEDHGVSADFTPWWTHLCLLVPDARHREHLLDWMAFTLQRPAEKINHCVVFGGNPGQGKDTLFWPLCKALGRHAKQVAAEALTSEFNDYLVEAKLVVFQEIDMGTRKEASQIANRMKPYLASPPDTLFVNPKGSKAFYIRNVVHALLYTNEEHPALIKEQDRRYFVLTSHIRVTDEYGQQTPDWANYFSQLWYWMDVQQGWRAVVGYLMARDLSHFNPKAAPPMTEAKRTIIDLGRTPLEMLLRDLIEARAGIFADDYVSSGQIVAFLATEGASLLQTYGLRDLPSQIDIGRRLRAMGLNEERTLTAGGRARQWRLR